MKNKLFLSAIAVVTAFVGGYWYYSPYLALRDIRDAVQRKNVDAFNKRIDYPKVRESLKGQISVMMAGNAAFPNDGLAVIGTMFGMALVNQTVDALVRPESVMHAMKIGEINLNQPSARPGAQAVPDKKPVEWTLERKNIDKIIAYRHESGGAIGKDFSVVFERQGFADWKLTEIRMDKIL